MLNMYPGNPATHTMGFRMKNIVSLCDYYVWTGALIVVDISMICTQQYTYMIMAIRSSTGNQIRRFSQNQQDTLSSNAGLFCEKVWVQYREKGGEREGERERV
jgi:hypothetical protein